jgi:cob(I)alamin adenosyltransferase
MHIYTRTGDKGETGLANGQRVAKDSAVIDFIGNLDELNAFLGMCVSLLYEDGTQEDFNVEIEILESIQKDLFKVGAIAAGSKMVFDSSKEVSNIEETINDYEKILPKLKNFILPGGGPAAAQIHITRTLVRRIERQAVALKSKSIHPFLPYLNRLSDLLFVMARYVNFKLKIQETKWVS